MQAMIGSDNPTQTNVHVTVTVTSTTVQPGALSADDARILVDTMEQWDRYGVISGNIGSSANVESIDL